MTIQVSISVPKGETKCAHVTQVDAHTRQPSKHTYRVDPGSILTLSVWETSGLLITEHDPREQKAG